MEQQITLEMLYQRTVTLEETLSLILALLTKEDRKKKEAKEEKDELSSIPPIPNAMAARLLTCQPVSSRGCADATSSHG